MLGPSITFGYLAARDIAGLAFPEAPVVAMAQNTSG
jgi:hypothetical protein